MIAKGAIATPLISRCSTREWPARKAAFERWLAPENFDADGRQRTSLRELSS